MTSADAFAKTHQPKGRFRLPDPPQRESDEMTSYDHLHKLGNSHHLAQHFGNPETTLVEADRWIVADPSENMARARRPDLLIAFGVHPEGYQASNGYVISEQGKPPDFVMEIASESTARIDVVEKRVEYAELGIPEYWRFDETGEHHGSRLAGGPAGGRPVRTHAYSRVARRESGGIQRSAGAEHPVGRTAGWAGTTSGRGGTSRPMKTSVSVPTTPRRGPRTTKRRASKPNRALTTPKRGSESWKRSCGGFAPVEPRGPVNTKCRAPQECDASSPSAQRGGPLELHHRHCHLMADQHALPLLRSIYGSLRPAAIPLPQPNAVHRRGGTGGHPGRGPRDGPPGLGGSV